MNILHLSDTHRGKLKLDGTQTRVCVPRCPEGYRFVGDQHPSHGTFVVNRRCAIHNARAESKSLTPLERFVCTIVSRPIEIRLNAIERRFDDPRSVPRGKVCRSEPGRNARGMAKGMRERIESWRLRGSTRSRHAHALPSPLEIAPGTLISFNQTPDPSVIVFAIRCARGHAVCASIVKNERKHDLV